MFINHKSSSLICILQCDGMDGMDETPLAYHHIIVSQNYYAIYYNEHKSISRISQEWRCCYIGLKFNLYGTLTARLIRWNFFLSYSFQIYLWVCFARKGRQILSLLWPWLREGFLVCSIGAEHLEKQKREEAEKIYSGFPPFPCQHRCEHGLWMSRRLMRTCKGYKELLL